MFQNIKNKMSQYAPLAACFAIIAAMQNTAQAALPDVGVDVGTVATDFGTALGAVVLVIVGIYGAYLVVSKGLKWLRRSA